MMSETKLQTANDVLICYLQGERYFLNLELSDEGKDFSSASLEGATFEKCCLHSANFRNAQLKGTTFRECNVKCSDFHNADLRNSNFYGSMVEAVYLEGANLEGASFEGAWMYGCELGIGEIPFDSEVS